MSDPNAGPAPRPDLPPRCNHLIVRNQNSSVKGTWHVDTALVIPEALLAPLEEFDGTWNLNEQMRKKKDKKGKRRSSDSVPTSNPNAAIRPNLMLRSQNGSVGGEVHVVSSDGAVRPVLIVADGYNGSVTLEVVSSSVEFTSSPSILMRNLILQRTYAEQPLRIFATSQNGSVRVRIPQSFEGAVMMSTQHGGVKFSDLIKVCFYSCLNLFTFSHAHLISTVSSHDILLGIQRHPRFYRRLASCQLWLHTSNPQRHAGSQRRPASPNHPSRPIHDMDRPARLPRLAKRRRAPLVLRRRTSRRFGRGSRRIFECV
jgi:hypothetical protein